jgi:hypothetical protein
MRRELGQLSLADGLVEGGVGRNRQLERIAALVDWAAFERLLGEVYAAPAGRAAVLPAGAPAQVPLAAAVVPAVRSGPRGSPLGPPELPSLRRARAGRPGARPFDAVAVPQRAEPARAGRATAGRTQPPARRPGNDGQGRHADRRQPGRGGLPAATQGERVEDRSDRDASWNAMPRSRCSATRCTSRSTAARAWCGGRS